MNTPALFKPRVLTLQTSGYWFIGFLIATLAAFWPVRAAAMGDEQFAAEGHAFCVPLAAAIQVVGAWTMAMLGPSSDRSGPA